MNDEAAREQRTAAALEDGTAVILEVRLKSEGAEEQPWIPDTGPMCRADAEAALKTRERSFFKTPKGPAEWQIVPYTAPGYVVYPDPNNPKP